MAEPRLTDPAVLEESGFASALAEMTQSLVCVLDRDARILFFNHACEQATGFTRDEVLGRDARDLVIPPEETVAFGDVLDHVWETGHSSPQVGHWLTKDGGRRLIAWSNMPVLGSDRAPRYLVTSGLDITEREGRAPDTPEDFDVRLAEVARLAQEQRALRRVAMLVAAEASPERVFSAVSEECARVLDVNASAVLRFEGDDTATVVGHHDRGVAAFELGERIHFDDTTAIGRARDTGMPARIDDYSAHHGEIASRITRTGNRSTVAAPIFVAGIPWGAVAVASSTSLPVESEVRLGAFCELVSLAVASAQARQDLQASRTRLVRTGDEQRQRLERNLHDGAQQHLIAIALALRLARAQVRSSPDVVEPLLEQASHELDEALDELRELARGLHPAILTDRGLAQALESLRARVSVPVEIDVSDERYEPEVEATVYYIAAEALTNAVKHADASVVRIALRREDDALHFEITDDGAGGANPSAGTGILGLRDRAAAIGGSLVVISSPGHGTAITATLPLQETTNAGRP